MLGCKMLFDILNRLGVAHECDGQTDRRRMDGRTEPPLTIAQSNEAC